MNQFHSSYSRYCRTCCDGSLIALGGKIPDVSNIMEKIDHVLSGKKPTDDPVLQKK